jgi:hypothetical protein
MAISQSQYFNSLKLLLYDLKKEVFFKPKFSIEFIQIIRYFVAYYSVIRY